jgi:hypothetical protein
VTIREQEDLIRRREREWAFAWNSEGHLILEKEGERNKIEFDDEEVALINRATLTHNHPSGLLFAENDPRSFGHSFSEDDIRLACLAELVEVRAVTPKLRFSMKPPHCGWNLVFWETRARPSFIKCHQRIWQQLDEAFISGAITPAEASIRVLHETWGQVANEVSLIYTQEED